MLPEDEAPPPLFLRAGECPCAGGAAAWPGLSRIASMLVIVLGGGGS